MCGQQTFSLCEAARIPCLISSMPETGISTAAQIHPALIVFALVTGEHMAGIAGALLAVPVYSILQTFFFFLKSMVEELEKEPAVAEKVV